MSRKKLYRPQKLRPLRKLSELPDVPLLSMSRDDLNDTFAAIGLGINHHMLCNARRGEGQRLTLAVALLETAEGVRIVTADMEHGDGVGIEFVDNFVDECARTPGMLATGESIRREVWSVEKRAVLQRKG